MINFSKTTLLSIFLAVFVIAAGFFAYQWGQIKGELGKQIEENENLAKQVEELQKEIEELKSAQVIKDATVDIEKQEIVITTDKIEYRQGEEVKMRATLVEKGTVYIWGAPWEVQKLEKDSWDTVAKNGCLFFPNCEDIDFEKMKECSAYFSLCEQPRWAEVRGVQGEEILDWMWDQLYEVKREKFKCYQYIDYQTGESDIVEEECVRYTQASPGKYKIRFEYATNINPNDEFDRNVDIKYVEKDFRIVIK